MIAGFIRKNTFALSFFQGLKCLFIGKRARQFEPEVYPKTEKVIEISRGRKHNTYFPIPKVVWLYWEDDKIPAYISQMMEHNKQVNPGYVFRLLNKDTYRQYLPDILFEDNMPIANKTDVIRLELLLRYGGIWLDATIVLRDNLDWIQHVNQNNHNELIGFYRDNDTLDYTYPVVETYFMAAPAGSLFVKHWIDLFRDIITLGSEKFYNKLQKRDDYDEIKQKIPNPSYLLVYLAGQAACREYPDYHVYLKKAEDSALFLQECYRNNYMMNYAICKMDNPMKNLPIIKLCSGDRMFVRFYQKMNMIRHNSFIGYFTQKEARG